MSDNQPFSRRVGYRAAEPAITVREDAPDELRYGLVMLAHSLGLSPLNARLEVCGILLKRPDPSNWSAYPNVFAAVRVSLRTVVGSASVDETGAETMEAAEEASFLSPMTASNFIATKS